MKKKILSILVLILSIFSLSSCNNKSQNENIEKIHIKRDINIETSIDLYATNKDRPNIKNMVENKETFLLYGYLPTCQNCMLFSDIYNDYVKTNKAVLYCSYVSDIRLIFEDAPNKAPYLAIIRDGEMKETFTFSDNKSLFTSKENFENFMNKYCILDDIPVMADINKNTLDKWIEENKDFVVYFGWNQCSDCAFFEEAYLQEFLKNNNKQFYYFETAPYHPGRDATEKENKEWQDFKLKYGFGSYREGRIPSIVYYKDGKCIDFAVYLNDDIIFDKDNNKVIVIDSYYKDNPNIGKEFNGTSISDAYENYKEGSKEFFNKKMDKFFTNYLK